MSLSYSPLATAAAGEEVRVRAVRGVQQQVRRLRELGLLEGQTIRVVCNDDPLICQIGECRLGVCRRLARCVFVEPTSSTVARLT